MNINYNHTLSVQILTTLDNSLTTRSVHFNDGSFNLAICFLTIASNAISGVNKPTLIPIRNIYRYYIYL